MAAADILSRSYKRIFHQLQEYLAKTKNKFSRMATVASLLHHKMPLYFWTGFYVLDKGELTVGPYQGPLACPVLEKKKGVCWAGILNKKTIVVPDVLKFSGYIACDIRTNSEIVIPLFDQKGNVWAILDVDSREFDAFSKIDQEWLEKIVQLI
ncbi:MAG: GAF domain-containing protein [Candidatus Aminicenantales bacterium]